MQISWKGQACFHIVAQRNKQEQVKLVIDPFDPSIGLKMPPSEADVVLATHDHEDHNNIKAVGGAFAVTGPGEYEIKDVSIQGIPSFHDEVEGKERGRNTIYVIDVEGVRLCHLGDLGQNELTSDQVSKIGNADILFVPVGGVYTIGAKEAARVIGQIEPRIAVPMHYLLPGLKFKLDKIENFLKEMGVKNAEVQNKLVVKARDLSSEEMSIVVLTP